MQITTGTAFSPLAPATPGSSSAAQPGGVEPSAFAQLLAAQQPAEIAAVRIGQAVVDHQTTGLAPILAGEKLGPIGIGQYGKALDLEREFERVQHSRIIVNNDNGLLGSCISFGGLHSPTVVFPSETNGK